MVFAGGVVSGQLVSKDPKGLQLFLSRDPSLSEKSAARLDPEGVAEEQSCDDPHRAEPRGAVRPHRRLG